ncbi:MAG: ABC transporter permease [Syntrophobacteraceae bacterium]|nr:ABC transporter permease [Desulfobacteraceae bacterium]
MLLDLLALTLGKAAPLLFAGFGGLLSEVSGVINFALEGMMLAGAFGAVWAAQASGSPWIGLLGGAAAGLAAALVHAVASLTFRANQIVSAIALNLAAAGLTGMLLNQVFGVYGTSPSVNGLPALDAFLPASFAGWNGLSDFVSRIPLLVPAALAICLLVAAFFRWTAWGLRLRACGENPQAAAAAGLSVMRIRFLAVLAGGVLAGAGGAYLSIGELSQFVEQMTQGRGYLAIAAVILGRWRPAGVFAAALFFGLCEALSEWLAVRLTALPNQAFLAFPYIVCLGVLLFHPGRKQPPSALGRL